MRATVIGVAILTAILPNPVTAADPSPAATVLPSPPASPTPTPNLPANAPPAIPMIARRITMRLQSDRGAGSGIIFRRNGRIYQILTCEHVIAEARRLEAIAPDGKIYPIAIDQIRRIPRMDIAIVSFRSEINYQTAKLAASSATIGDQVFAVGFPNFSYSANNESIQSNIGAGNRVLEIINGSVEWILPQSLARGYQLGYTSEVRVGMSGGAVLDDRGELVGMNGRLKYPATGIGAFTFADGTKPSQRLYERMERLSWAIPLPTILQAINTNNS
jgi:S1-C subfamily serine protease